MQHTCRSRRRTSVWTRKPGFQRVLVFILQSGRLVMVRVSPALAVGVLVAAVTQAFRMAGKVPRAYRRAASSMRRSSVSTGSTPTHSRFSHPPCPFHRRKRADPIRRHTNVAGTFPTRPSIICLVGTPLAGQHGEWAIARSYMSLDGLTQARIRLIEPDHLEDVTPTLESATGRKPNNEATRRALIHHLAGRDLTVTTDVYGHLFEEQE